MNGLSLLMDNELFAVDVTLVEKVVRNMTVTSIPAAPAAVIGITNLKGGVVTLLSLAELLGRSRNPNAAYAVILKSLSSGNDRMGLLIDSPGDLIRIDDNEILPPGRITEEYERSFISGLADSDGNLYRIIDIEAILNFYRET